MTSSKPTAEPSAGSSRASTDATSSSAPLVGTAAKTNRKGLGLSLVLLLGVVIVGVLSLRTGGQKGEKVRVTTSESRTITSRVLAQGKIRAKRQVDVAPEISGRVIEVFVKVGNHVEVGDPLFSLDDEQYQNGVAQIRVAVNAADASVQRMQLLAKEAERNLRRDQDLVKRNIGSQESVRVLEARLAMSHTDVRQAKAQRERARLDLLRAKESLRKTRVLAPLSGTVVAVGLEVGQIVSNLGAGGLTASPMGGSSRPHVVISDLSELTAMLDVDELDIARVVLKQRAHLRAQGAIDTPYYGVVEEVGLLGQSIGGAVSFGVKVRIEPPSSSLAKTSVGALPEIKEELRFGLLRPGMSITSEIEVERLENAVVVPVSSILEGARDGDKDRIFVLKNDRAEERNVKIGPSEGDVIAVLSGVRAGEVIVEGPFRALRTLEDGSALVVEETVPLPKASLSKSAMDAEMKEKKGTKENDASQKTQINDVKDAGVTL
ncbi:MAG: efflux RND transporter periplasmic adaptor subunit [Deltaproteobacteria bacterium]|nr:efflux RND transporter periplasmic adaptor subunit [Deltaproteobacteria bacterium]